MGKITKISAFAFGILGFFGLVIFGLAVGGVAKAVPEYYYAYVNLTISPTEGASIKYNNNLYSSGAQLSSDYGPITISYVLNENYNFLYWTVDGVTKTDESLTFDPESTFVMGNSDKTYNVCLYVEFVEPSFDITVTTNAEMGTVSGGGSFINNGTESTTISATAKSGYVFDHWENSTGESVSTNATYTFTVTKSETYTAIFREAVVTISSASGGDEIASISIEKTINSINHLVNFATGYYLANINDKTLKTNSGVLSVSGCLCVRYSTNNSASGVYLEVVGVSSDCVILLTFSNTPNNLSESSGSFGFSVSATEGGVAMIRGDDFENLAETDTILYIAKMAQTGYQFVKWVDNNGNLLGTELNLLLTKAEASSIAVIAVFEKINSNVNFDTNNENDFV